MHQCDITCLSSWTPAHTKTTQGSQKLEKLTENRRDYSQF